MIIRKNRVSIVTSLIPVLYFIFITLAILLYKNAIGYNLTEKMNSQNVYYIINIYFVLINYLIIFALAYENIIVPFESGEINNKLLYPISRNKIILKPIMKVLLFYILSQVVFNLLFTFLINNLTLSSDFKFMVLENNMYSFYAQLAMVSIIGLIAVICKKNITFIVAIAITFLLNIAIGGILINLESLWCFFPNVLISIYTMPVSIPVGIANVGLVVSILYMILAILMYVVIFKQRLKEGKI